MSSIFSLVEGGRERSKERSPPFPFRFLVALYGLNFLCVCVYAGYGVTSDGHTVFINCSTCDFNYKPRNLPIVFDLPNKPEQ